MHINKPKLINQSGFYLRTLTIEPRKLQVVKKSNYWVGRFTVMASPCELFIDTEDAELAHALSKIAFDEALRIEHKFSRYRNDNIIYQINNSNNKSIKVDEETAQLLNFSQQCFELSEGLFDITSGVLRHAWTFDGSSNFPTTESIEKLLPMIGWEKANWNDPLLNLPPDMEIDLGGIGKEYAVDKITSMLQAQSDVSMLVNFGGDLTITGPRSNGDVWFIGIESPDIPGDAVAQLEMTQGALTTSGDSQRFLIKNGKRYSHVLNPRTGWPVEHAPRSVTVAANNCTEAGIISTLALLNGKDAENFLKAQGVKFWCQR